MNNEMRRNQSELGTGQVVFMYQLKFPTLLCSKLIQHWYNIGKVGTLDKKKSNTPCLEGKAWAGIAELGRVPLKESC